MAAKSVKFDKTVAEQMETIARGAVEIIPEELLKEKLERAVETGKPLIVKQGFDPTAPDIHLGHAVGLRKLRDFQDLGHTAVFLIGDFTGLIGDPSGRSDTRNRMDHDELAENAKTYTKQAFKILDSKKTVVEYNSSWLAPMKFADVLKLTATTTVAQLIERDDFQKRYRAGKPISLLEFVYPLAQGFDSVALKADVELGATEQKFNLLMARDIQRQYGQEPQVILTMPILEGIDGVEKMSKSLGNYIGITEVPEEMFGKTMKIPDELIIKYFELVTDYTLDQIADVKTRLGAPGANPSHLKRELGRAIVTLYHDETAATNAEAHFDRIHVAKDHPDEMPSVSLDADADGLWIVHALTKSEMCESSSAARRMIAQGAVRIDGDRIDDVDLKLAARSDAYIVKVGKRKFVELHVG